MRMDISRWPIVGKPIGAIFFCTVLFPAPSLAQSISSSNFENAAYPSLPTERLYEFRDVMVKEFNSSHRDPEARAKASEIEIPAEGWSLVYAADAGPVVKVAAHDFADHLSTSMQIRLLTSVKPQLQDWATHKNAIVVGVSDQMPGCGNGLQGPKDYQVIVSDSRITVCGYDDRGAMYGLYNLESRMELRGGPFLPATLNTVRHSLFGMRMTMSGLGWMDWPDWYLRMVPRYGFDSILVSVYANPNGEKAPSLWGAVMRRQDSSKMHDLIKRASRYGLNVYAQLLYPVRGDATDEVALRKLVRDNATAFPEIRGYFLLPEGFTYGDWWPTWSSSREDTQSWFLHWVHGVEIATDELHKINPKTEVLAWDYNIDFRRQAVDIKSFDVAHYPADVVPFITWENGKSFIRDGEEGYLKDYAINEVGPAEVAEAQMDVARKRGMKVYVKADTFVSWQYGTLPYLPLPYQWYERYQGLEKAKVDGVLETWTYGLKPNFMARIRAWYSWSDAPPLDDLLRQYASSIFGSGSEDATLSAWKHFSNAIRLVPDTGPRFGTTNSSGSPLFFNRPEPRTMTFEHSWNDPELWTKASEISPYWPYAARGFVLIPDFSNKVNVAEKYAQPFTLPVFEKYLLLAADEMEKGLASYRTAALASPSHKRHGAYREVLIAEQLQRMMRSDQAILEFEDLRFRLSHTADKGEQAKILRHMQEILRSEIGRTQSSLETVRRDSRMGYEWENDYFFTPYVLQEKFAQLHTVLDDELPAYARSHNIQ